MSGVDKESVQVLNLEGDCMGFSDKVALASFSDGSLHDGHLYYTMAVSTLYGNLAQVRGICPIQSSISFSWLESLLQDRGLTVFSIPVATAASPDDKENLEINKREKSRDEPAYRYDLNAAIITLLI